MIDHVSAEDLATEIRDYQQHHKTSAEKMLRNEGFINPPFFTVLVYNNELEDFQYLAVPVDPQFFANKEGKAFFVQDVVPHNLQRMIDQKLMPVALTMTMEASMRIGDPNMSIEEVMKGDPTDILMHSYDTVEGSQVQILKMIRKDVKVVNPDGDVIDDFELEEFKMGDENTEMGGLFANVLKKFYETKAV